MTRHSVERRAPLRARTTLIDDAHAFPSPGTTAFTWWHDGRGIVAEGVARIVVTADVADALAAIADHDDRAVAGTGPVALGALPFDRGAASQAHMVIPARLWRRDAEGRRWYTEVSGGAGIDQPVSHVTGGGLGRFDGDGDMTEEQWGRAVTEVLSAIGHGALDKVVLARTVTVAAEAELACARVVARLVRDQPHCFVFAVDGFVGASPELLVQRRGDVVRSRPMAGTVPHNDHDAVTALGRSAKDGWEHALVVDAVTTRLRRLCTEPLSVSEPHAEPFADLAHIVTDVTGRLSAPAPSALDLALALHPTPAVAGAPTDKALALITALETRRRGLYGGPVGWVDANGDGEFAIALRCAQLNGHSALLYAGAGIVAGSRWQDEWRETEVKLEPMRRALGVTDHYVGAAVTG